MSEIELYRMTSDEALAALGSDARLGLGEQEARKRLERHSTNELTAEKAAPAWKKFLAYVPFLQQAFSTTALSVTDWLLYAAVASSVLWLRELSKLITR
jgi:magnesium-transporting ATPase (P-type)